MRRMPADPIRRFQRWYAAARRTAMRLPDAMALATVDGRGRPRVRMVLLKQADEDGFVFYTNARSPKGRELLTTGRAALVFYWEPLARQVRIEGRVRLVDPAEADAYWATRPRQSQLAALASAQSAPLASRALLLRRFHILARRYDGRPVPRPPYWTGFRIMPSAIEFWTERPFRLHDRELFTRTAGGWKMMRLQP
ncbi:MAG: pyridoxamine 5'-phosphate oxidase [Candidatus Binatia bacterium]